MTRAELIARIEAGETGIFLDSAIHELAGFCGHPPKSLIPAGCQSDTGFTCAICGADSWGNLGVHGERLRDSRKPYTTSLDAAVALVGGYGWSLLHRGQAAVWGGKYPERTFTADIQDRHAAALVAAWLKATADE